MKQLLVSILTMFALLLSPTMVLAQQGVRFDPQSTAPNQVGGCTGAASGSSVCTEIKSDTNPLFGPDGILTKVARIFTLLVGVIATFMLIISGLRYINSGGDPSKTASAKNGILYSAIGIMVAAIAQSIVIFILSKQPS